jgi:PAS domain S-box-containing protein
MKSSAPKDPTRAVNRGPLERRSDVVRILRASLLSLFCGGIGVALISSVFWDSRSFVGGMTIALITPLLILAMRRGHTRFATTSGVAMLLAVVSTEVVVADGIHDVGISLLPVVILISALLLDRRTSYALSALAVLTVAIIGTAEAVGLLHTRLSHLVVPGEVVILVFLLAMSAVLIHAVARAMYKAIDEAALHEQTYREIFNATSEGIFVFDVTAGRVVDVNETACAITGLPRETLCEATLAQLAKSSGDIETADLEALTRRAQSEGPQTFEWKLTRHDGHEVWLEVALRAAEIRGEPRVLAALRDVSDRKAVAERLRDAERLQSVGQLAGGVAHDFNNQLTGILANAALLKEKLKADPAARGFVEEIIQCSNRSADLTRQLLAFARKGGRREEVIDVDAVVREVVSLLERSIDKRVELELDLLGDGRARVMGDASFLQSALLNLGINARDAMPEGGQLRFSTYYIGREQLPASARAQLPELAPTYVCVRVSDTGIGIAPELLARIFEPFFTTKENGHGMGLPAAYGTVHAHGGAIIVHSRLGEGTTFELFLPATELLHAPEPMRPLGEPLPKIRVLLAEDERVVGRATEALLQDMGCAVTWCRDGREALDAFERDVSAFDLLLLDHSMPGMLGSEVARRVLRLRPRLPIISTSGFSEGAEEMPGRNRVFLQKPFDLDQLTAAVQQALGWGARPLGSDAE